MDAVDSTPLTLHVFGRPVRVVDHRPQLHVLDEITDFHDEDTVWAPEPTLEVSGPYKVRLAPRPSSESASAARVTMLALGFVFGGGFAVVSAGIVTLATVAVGGVVWLGSLVA